MEIKTEKQRLIEYIEVLEKAYCNIVKVMNEDIEEKEDEKGVKTIALKDEKIKTYADGIKNSAQTLKYLFSEITESQKNLKELDKELKTEEKTASVQENSDLNGRLN